MDASASAPPGKLPPPPPPACPVFPELMLDAMRGAWVAGIQRGASRARTEGSPTKALSGLVGEDLKVRGWVVVRKGDRRIPRDECLWA